MTSELKATLVCYVPPQHIERVVEAVERELDFVKISRRTTHNFEEKGREIVCSKCGERRTGVDPRGTSGICG